MPVRSFSPGDLIEVRTDEPFVVLLEEPSATGYGFDAMFDPSLIQLNGRCREIGEQVGASSKVTFNFSGRSRGAGTLTFRLTAPWEDGFIHEITLPVRIC